MNVINESDNIPFTEALLYKEILYRVRSICAYNADKPIYGYSDIKCSVIKRISTNKKYIELNGGKPEHNDIGWIDFKDILIIDVLNMIY